ncbi:MAG: hypothetical protein JW735_05965 [Prolixibacteraceae bacterium]|jgi:hypothetical protein|nr:hypothetical protein [Prolixibacteraceae bacterium]
MRRILFSAIFFVSSLIVTAQNEGFELVTDRPDQTESSAVVPKNALQIESGFILEQETPNLLNEKHFTYNTTLMRYGLFNNFELRLGFEYLGNTIIYNLQFDVSAGLGINKNSPNSFIGFGLSCRIPD